MLQVKEAQYVKAAYKMGHSKFKVAKEHILPHVMPVYLVGLVLLFPLFRFRIFGGNSCNRRNTV